MEFIKFLSDYSTYAKQYVTQNVDLMQMCKFNLGRFWYSNG